MKWQMSHSSYVKFWRKNDDNNHYVPAGTNYMVCNYLEKVSENFNQRTVQYKHW